jgi:hypothetical protein
MILIECPCCRGSGEVQSLTGVSLSMLERRIYEIVQSCGGEGIDMHRLSERVYADRRDGGPEYAADSIRATICRMNKRLAASGRQVKASTLGRGAGYRVVPL